MSRNLSTPTIYGSEYNPLSFSEAYPDVKLPVEIVGEELKRLTVTIAGFDFISFGSALICPICGKQAGILIDRAPDDNFKFYLRFPCKDYDPKETEAPLKVEIVTPLEGTVADESTS